MPGMTPEEAREHFGRARVATLGTVGAPGRPHLVPVVFALSGDTLVFAVDHKPKRTGRLRRLENIRAEPAVCLLADAWDEDWDQLWWARADGTGRVLDTPAGSALSARYTGLLVEKYRAQYGSRPPQGPVVEVTVERWSGWRAS